MALALKQELRLTQQLVMTPQLQQAIKLLQLSRLELVNVVQQELQENPVLEEVAEAEAESMEKDGPDSEEARNSLSEGDVSPANEREPSDADKFADVDWQNYIESNPQTAPPVVRDDDERRSLENNARRSTLAEHLEWQLGVSDFSDEERVAARWIIGNLDEDGYFRGSLEELSRQCGVPLEIVESALAKVQQFDPTGVAARDLRECLLLQVRSLGIADPVVFGILQDCWEEVKKRDFRGAARALGVTIEEVTRATRIIGRLEPRPGRAYGGDDPIYIEPDIYVTKVADDFHIVLNEDGMPKLRISNLYRGVLTRGATVGKDTKDYVQDKVRSAVWLIKSIHQRQRTIYKVMESIIRHQRDFFERGIAFLKPLNLRDVAEDIEMHESTVSRVTTNKYVHCPQGVFELKYFFNSSIRRLNGEDIASESVKDQIRRIITNEDPRKPLSDQRIAEMLKVSNIDIARRTVTKYREALNILSSTKRREVG
ncbi:MAG: RNA polymerase factor sigma-54 [Deltaproteobacteria bacterium]|nr:MAG: RNA polymerase factor sigma-54 [Deltaproteobacteria bacterium]